MILISWGAGTWLWAKLMHQAKSIHDSTPLYFVHAPEWLIWLCGKPRSDKHLELGGILLQLMMILDLLLIPIFLILSVEYRKRALIFFAVWCIPIGVIGLFRIVIHLWQKLS
jgi:hypothetical protein